MKIPTQLRSGDSISWLDAASSDNLGNVVDSSTYTLRYALRGPSLLNLTGSANGSGWQVDVSTTQSSILKAGVYFWQAWAEKEGSKVTLGGGQIEILPNLINQGLNFDGRSQSQKDLDAVDLAIRTLIAGGAVAEYTIGNRSMKKMTLSDLLLLQSQLKADVTREKTAEKIANGEGNPNAIFVRFKK